MPYLCRVKPAFVLQQTFMALVARYTADAGLAETLWQELGSGYSRKQRHYHTLTHLEKLLEQLAPITGIDDWDTLLFALFYHDIVYKATRKDNEEKSAELARERLTQLQYHPQKTARCVAHILATRSHTPSADGDTNLFTDADLSILGADTDTYRNYTRQIRAEYAVYPDFMYLPGRKKVVQHFLQMEHIFKTDYFRNGLETQARQNLRWELETLG